MERNSQINTPFLINKTIENTTIPQNYNNQLPNQQLFSFDNVYITSSYNSANLLSCKRTSNTSYSLEIAPDCEGIPLDHQISTYKIWFYFAVKSLETQSLSLTISNLNNFYKIFKSGYQIVSLELDYNIDPSDFEKSYTENEEYQWTRLNTNYNINIIEETNQVELTFKYPFTKDKYTLFAFCYPWSYDKNQNFLMYLNNKIKSNPLYKKIYFHNEVLISSKEKRNVNLITITSKNNISKKNYESKLSNLFPDKNRCLQSSHDIPIVFISARVHPGETPSSLMMNGILKLLTHPKAKESQLLRENFVFKIIPMINVDGISHGHFRLDTNGQNLNRCYLNPDVKTEPENYAIRKLFLYYNTNFKVRYYFDLHADMNVRGVYTFGNAIEDFMSHVENVLFSYIFSINSSHVNWERCTFKEGCMKSKFKFDKNSKEASSRVHFYKQTGLIHTYTVESTYLGGNFNNKENEEEVEGDRLYKVEDFEDTGRKLLCAILDYEELTKSEMMENNEYKTIAECRSFIADDVQRKEDRFRFNYHNRNMVKEINEIKKWMSIKEQSEKFKKGRGSNYYNRAKSSGKVILPKLRKKFNVDNEVGKGGLDGNRRDEEKNENEDNFNNIKKNNIKMPMYNRGSNIHRIEGSIIGNVIMKNRPIIHFNQFSSLRDKMKGNLINEHFFPKQN